MQCRERSCLVHAHQPATSRESLAATLTARGLLKQPIYLSLLIFWYEEMLPR